MTIELMLRRAEGYVDTTFGDLAIDGVRECFTLEDTQRQVAGVPVAQWKLHGRTAIPTGRYQVVLEHSPKFGPDTLTLVGVEGFQYIRIHALNDDSETEGCIGPGQAKLVDPFDDGGNILRSGLALTALREKIVPRIKAGEQCYITIVGLPTTTGG